MLYVLHGLKRYLSIRPCQATPDLPGLQAKSQARPQASPASSRRASASSSPAEGTVWKRPTSLDELLQDLYDSQARP